MEKIISVYQPVFFFQENKPPYYTAILHNKILLFEAINVGLKMS